MSPAIPSSFHSPLHYGDIFCCSSIHSTSTRFLTAHTIGLNAPGEPVLCFAYVAVQQLSHFSEQLFTNCSHCLSRSLSSLYWHSDPIERLELWLGRCCSSIEKRCKFLCWINAKSNNVHAMGLLGLHSFRVPKQKADVRRDTLL